MKNEESNVTFEISGKDLEKALKYRSYIKDGEYKGTIIASTPKQEEPKQKIYFDELKIQNNQILLDYIFKVVELKILQPYEALELLFNNEFLVRK